MCFLPTLFSVLAFFSFEWFEIFEMSDPLTEQHCLHLDKGQDTTRSLKTDILSSFRMPMLLHCPLCYHTGHVFLDFSVNSVSLIGMKIDKKYNNLLLISNISQSPLYNLHNSPNYYL